MNFFRCRPTNDHRNPREDAMIQFADVFAYGVSTAVLMVGTSLLLTAATIMLARMNRVPTTVRAFEMAPAFGL
jgi:hypothetical protein